MLYIVAEKSRRERAFKNERTHRRLTFVCACIVSAKYTAAIVYIFRNVAEEENLCFLLKRDLSPRNMRMMRSYTSERALGVRTFTSSFRPSVTFLRDGLSRVARASCAVKTARPSCSSRAHAVVLNDRKLSNYRVHTAVYVFLRKLITRARVCAREEKDFHTYRRPMSHIVVEDDR